MVGGSDLELSRRGAGGESSAPASCKPRSRAEDRRPAVLVPLYTALSRRLSLNVTSPLPFPPQHISLPQRLQLPLHPRVLVARPS